MTNARFLSNSDINERIGLPLFFVLMLACWVGAIPMVLSSYGKALPGAVKLLQVLMLFGPALVASFCAAMNGGRTELKKLWASLLKWRVNPQWYFLALLVPPIAFAVSLWLSNQLGFTNKPFPTVLQILINFLTTFGVYALLNTEEIAWRGYALPRLQGRVGPLKATIYLGIIWTFFHLPLFWIKGGHPGGYPFWLFSIMVMTMSFLFTAAFNGSFGSVLIVHLLHQSFNATGESIPSFPRSVNSFAPVLFALSMLFVLGIVLFRRTSKNVPQNTSG